SVADRARAAASRRAYPTEMQRLGCPAEYRECPSTKLRTSYSSQRQRARAVATRSSWTSLAIARFAARTPQQPAKSSRAAFETAKAECPSAALPPPASHLHPHFLR